MVKTIHILFLTIVFAVNNNFKSQIKPSAKFTFDNKNDLDEITGKKIRSNGVSYTYDRFGNANNAIYLFGNQYSYINLGNYTALKPTSGSISLWIKIENEVSAGKGYKFNPILLTKCAKEDDFFEAYSIFYLPETKKLNVTCTKDSVTQIGITSIQPIEHYDWHHLVITYNYSWLSFYIDGKLEKKMSKNYTTQFLESDSVVVGSTANIKNQRYLMASVDDIEFFDRVLNDKEILELYHAPNPNKNKIILNWALIILAIIAFIIFAYHLIKRQIKLAVQKERVRLELHNKLLETELRVNRASMNPHFLFNSLNTLHNFILLNDIDIASDYLVKFSKLIRKILDSNMHDNISLDFEIEILEKYLEIENLRFEKNINFSIIIDDEIKPSSVKIPIMMLQPFVENAIWYGLLNKAGEKNITINFSLLEKKYIYCTIEDNGTGRKKESLTNLVEKKSLATNFIKQRLELLNKIHNLNCSLTIEDKPNNQGTIVKIVLPILNA
ncbi:MAG: histidine kinase [Bacteroidota bacterium]|nr:histidine kinase [Bacteroidota bacterium]MDP3146730.1 histidine kinase [Bacteroidota bacterium]MDP3557171.1 histidine kinase [Bacteroidota bacterium]